jgi:hypothetical protein
MRSASVNNLNERNNIPTQSALPAHVTGTNSSKSRHHNRLLQHMTNNVPPSRSLHVGSIIGLPLLLTSADDKQAMKWRTQDGYYEINQLAR